MVSFAISMLLPAHTYRMTELIYCICIGCDADATSISEED
jgi:hypothetical protein